MDNIGCASKNMSFQKKSIKYILGKFRERILQRDAQNLYYFLHNMALSDIWLVIIENRKTRKRQTLNKYMQ